MGPTSSAASSIRLRSRTACRSSRGASASRSGRWYRTRSRAAAARRARCARSHSPATPSCSTSSPDTPCAASPQRRSGRRRSLQHPETKRCTACRCTSLPAWRATSAGTLRPDCWPPGWRSCRVNICFSTSAPTARWRSAAAAGSSAAPWHPARPSRVRASRAACRAWTGPSAAYGMTAAFCTTSSAAVEPKGLCGSGLLDLTAVLLRLGVIAPGGRLLPPEDAPECPCAAI